MLRSLLFVLLAIAPYTMMKGQEIVVSETKNEVAQDAEWTELLVIGDNVDLRGYIVTDNRGQGDQRQSGPRFKDIAKWSHVRAGTIILIHHGPKTSVQNEDTDLSDGYVELSQLDLDHFTIVNVDGAAGSSGLNLNVDRDFVQVLRPDTVHVHGLGYGRPPGDTYDSTPAPKVNLDTLNIGASRSVGVTGRTLAAYRAGIGKDSLSHGLSVSPGLPNLIDNPKIQAGKTNVNHLFWRETREPKWTQSPTVTLVSRDAQKHVIEWTPAVDPYPTDKVTGYVILRDTLEFQQFPADAIVDGKIVSVGQRLGSALVLAVRPTDQGSTYADSLNLLCGQSYMYRIYAYRYRADDQLGQPDQTTARGRQYSPVYASSQRVTKPNPQKPVIQASRTEVCPGDTFALTTTTTSAAFYEWTVDGRSVPVGGTTRIVVTEPGTYRLRIYADGGCYADSDPVTVRSLPAQIVKVEPAGAQWICSGDTVTLTAQTTAASYEWLKDGVIIVGANGRSLRVTAPGSYRVRTSSASGCPGVSALVSVSVRTISFHFEPASLDFGQLGECETSKPLSVDLVNDGAEDITISSIAMPAGYSLLFPAPGFSVAKGSRQNLLVLFVPPSLGLTSGTARFTSSLCNVTVPLNLTGRKSAASVALDRAGIDYGIFSACPNSDIRADSGFFIVNNGSSRVTVTPPLVQPPFYLLTQFTQVDLDPTEGFEIRVQYRPFGTELDQGVSTIIAFPFKSSTCTDTLRATLQAASYLPRMTVEPTDIDVGTILGCVGFADTVLTIRNVSPVEVTLTGNRSVLVTMQQVPLTLKAGESRTISVRVSPPVGPTTFTITDSLLTSPCSLSIPVTFRGKVFAPAFTASPSRIDLPSVSFCDADPTSTGQYTISVAGSNGLRLPIVDVVVRAPFSASLATGVSLIDSLVNTITFRPTLPGRYTDTVRVIIAPCNDTVTCIVSGEALEGGRSTRITDTDFGILRAGETRQRTMTIVNTGTQPLEVDPLAGVIPPWSVVSALPPLPASITSGDSVRIVLQYEYLGPGRRDTITILSSTSGSCADTLRYTLTGATDTLPDTTITGIVVDLPSNVTARVGTTVDLPVALRAPMDLTGAGLRSMNVHVSYDPTILKIVDGTARQGTSITVREVRPGAAQITMATTTEFRAADTLMLLRGSTYLGSSRTTLLVVDSVIALGFDINGSDGSLTLIGDCAIETQVIALGQAPSLTLQRTGMQAVTLEVTTMTHDPLHVTLWSVDGIAMRELHSSVLPGRHVVTFDTSTLPSGAYIITMEHGLHHRSVKIALTR